MLTIMIEDSADYRIDIWIPLRYVYGKILTRDVMIVILRIHGIPDNIFPLFVEELNEKSKKSLDINPITIILAKIL